MVAGTDWTGLHSGKSCLLQQRPSTRPCLSAWSSRGHSQCGGQPGSAERWCGAAIHGTVRNRKAEIAACTRDPVHRKVRATRAARQRLSEARSSPTKPRWARACCAVLQHVVRCCNTLHFGRSSFIAHQTTLGHVSRGLCSAVLH